MKRGHRIEADLFSAIPRVQMTPEENLVTQNLMARVNRLQLCDLAPTHRNDRVHTSETYKPVLRGCQ
jgi:hypothetical protein